MPTIIYNVEMPCGGCSGACTRILSKVEGVTNVDANLDTQKVTVETADGTDLGAACLEKLEGWASKSGKKVSMA